jgi:kynurenine formamidase
MGQAWPFRIEEVSRYDERGPAWYWNNFSCGEHTGTHFDAPIHWVSGKDVPNGSVDTIPSRNFVARRSSSIARRKRGRTRTSF